LGFLFMVFSIDKIKLR